MADLTHDAFTYEEGWTAVSPRLITARRISLALSYLLVVVLIVIFLWVPDIPVWAPVTVGAVGVATFVWLWWLIGRRVRSFGYAERGDDLLVGSGIMFRRLVIVPYGRMQLVDVKAGPIDRMLGVTTVQLHTAAATTDATIPGLVPEVAAALRDRLAAKGEERSAGL